MPEAELRNLELWEDLQSGVQRLSGPDSGQNEVEDADEDKPSTPSFSSRTREQAHGLNPRNTSRPQFLSPHILPTTQSPKPPTETPPPPSLHGIPQALNRPRIPKIAGLPPLTILSKTPSAAMGSARKPSVKLGLDLWCFWFGSMCAFEGFGGKARD